MKSYIYSIWSNPNHGLWEPRFKGKVGIDFTSVAYWLGPKDPELLREVIRAKTNGPFRWEKRKNPARPYLVRERAALERLALLDKLTDEETKRLAELKASPLGDEPPEPISLSELLEEYASNEVRADEAYKGNAVEFTGVAGGLKRGALAGITLEISTGKRFEHPKVLCAFAESETEKVKALDRGDRIRVRGLVAGLMMDVHLRHCELVQ